ncbi:hypothetical protein THAOC_23766, partial [Thalassiosira oceanica]
MRSVRSGSSAAAAPPAKLFGLLLAGDRRRDWSAVRDHVLSHPSSAAAPYYRDETPLQLALRARERTRRAEKGHRDANAEDQPGEVTRIEALEALAAADPPSLLGRRDAEGRTALHT